MQNTRTLNNQIAKIDAELKSLSSQIEASESRLNAIPDEQSSLVARSRSRATSLAVARDNAKTAHEDFVSGQALVDIGAIKETSLPELEQALMDAEKALSKEEKKIAEAQSKDDSKEFTLRTEQEKLEKELVELYIKKDALERAKHDTQDELGRTIFESYSVQIDNLEKLAAQHRAELMENAEGLQKLIDEAVEALRPFPSYRKRIEPTVIPLPYSDDHTQIIEGYLEYLEAILAYLDDNEVLYPNLPYGNLLGAVYQECCYPMMSQLKRRQDDLQTWLTNYRREHSR